MDAAGGSANGAAHAAGLAAAATAAVGAGAVGAGLNPIDLERLFHEGDDRTWDLEEWNWDPSELVAAPHGVPTINACQALKRHKPDHLAGAAAAPAAAAADCSAGHCSLPGVAAGCCSASPSSAHGGMTSPHGHHQGPHAAAAAAAAAQQQELMMMQHQQWAAAAAAGVAPHMGMAGAPGMGFVPMAGAGGVLPLAHAGSGQLPPLPAGPADPTLAMLAGAGAAGVVMPDPVAAAAAAVPPTGRGRKRGAAAAAAAAAAPAPVAAISAQRDAAINAATLAAMEQAGGLEDDEKMICQVPGCGKDLSGLKDYHQRYRICAVHIRLPQVMKDGRLQRFCQQCGRFHDLAAFDGNRKSCREQLQKHNARRRRRAQLEQSASLAGSLTTAVDDKTEVGKLLQGLLSNPFQLQALRVLLGVKTHPALPDPTGFPAEHEAALAEAAAAAAVAAGDPDAAEAAAAAAEAAREAAGGAAGGAGGGGAGNPPSYEVARAIMEGSGPYAPDFDSDHRVVKLCMKLFNATPADLPADLKAQVTGWLSESPAGVESHIRPGCVMLTVQLLVGEACYEDARRAGLTRLLSNLLAPASQPFWKTATYLVQLFDTVAVVAGGRLVSAARLDANALAAAHLPAVERLSPPCVASAGAAAAVEFDACGSGLGGGDVSLIVRSQGRHLPVTAAAAEAPALGAAGARRCSLPAAAGAPPPAAGGARLLWVEAARGAYHSRARPLLVVSDPAIADEVSRLEQLATEGTLRPCQVDQLLTDLALVLQHVGAEAAAADAQPSSPRCCPGGGGCHKTHAAGAAAAPGLSHGDIVEKARRLLAFACDQGWANVAAAVLPLASARCACAADIVAAIHEATAHDGLSLLHRAVRSGSLPLVRGMLQWGATHGYKWDVGAGGPLGISPLHLAALLDDDAAVLLALLDACDGGRATAAQGCCSRGAGCCAGATARCACCAYTGALTDDGVSPFHLSLQHGHFSVDRVLASLESLEGPEFTRVTEMKMQLAGWELLRAATAGGDAAEGGAAAAAGGGGAGAPLGVHRQTSKLDACLYCQTTLPPLLLSIKAHCAVCGERQPCAAASPECRDAAAAAAAAVAAAPSTSAAPQAAPAPQGAGGARRGGRGSAAAESPAGVVAAVAAADAAAAPRSACAHSLGRVVSLTALCQCCHASRTLQVA